MNSPLTTPQPQHFRQQQATNEKYIVIEDPSGEYWDGSVLGAAQAKMLEARGVIALPYEPVLATHGNGGYMKRSWGAGYPLTSMTARMAAPLTLFCKKAFTHITWRARIMPNDDVLAAVRGGQKLEGILRLAADTGAPQTYVATISSKENPILIQQLGDLDTLDGWVIGGSGQINISQEGHYGFALFGMAPGVRVIWVAATTAQNP